MVIDKDLCATEATGRACAQVATSYHHSEEEFTESFRVTVTFYTGRDARDCIEMHRRELCQYHKSVKTTVTSDSDYEDSDNDNDDEYAAETDAQKWFNTVAEIARPGDEEIFRYTDAKVVMEDDAPSPVPRLGGSGIL